MFIRQDKDGNWYVCRRTSSNHTGKRHKSGRSGQPTSDTYRNWFLVKHTSTSASILKSSGNINCQKSFLGKRVRLKVEVME